MCDEHCKEEQVSTLVNAEAPLAAKVKDYSINVPFSEFNEGVDSLFKTHTREGRHVFFTDVPKPKLEKDEEDPGYLFKIWLENLPEEMRQKYNCNTCRDFLNVYGGLVVIDPETGVTTSALWDPVFVPDFFKPVVTALKTAVEKLRVLGHYSGNPLHKLETRGFIGTDEKGNFKHFSVQTHHVQEAVHGPSVWQNAQTIASHLGAWSVSLLETVNGYFENDPTLKCYQNFARNVAWALTIKRRLEATKHDLRRENIIWHAAATGTPGQVAIAAKVPGEFIKAIQNGVSLYDAISRLVRMADPGDYMRPTAEATLANIEQCEKIVEELGLQTALDRRALRFEEVPESAKIWTRKTPEVAPEAAPTSLFGALKEKALEKKENKDEVKVETVDGGRITFERFRSEVLPKADRVTIVLMDRAIYTPTFVVTQTDPDAKPLMKWDNEEHRNPVSSYAYQQQMSPEEFNAVARKEIDVVAFTCSVQTLLAKEHDTGTIFMVLDGVYDKRNGTGMALFPENLRKELFSVRSTIEEFSNQGTIKERDKGFGGFFIKDAPNLGVSLKVYMGKSTVTYLIDRFR